jgi:hypothetical protein
MKNLLLLAFFLFGLTFTVKAEINTTVPAAIPVQTGMSIDNATTVTMDDSADANDAAAEAKHKKKHKKFKDRSVAGKILIIAGVAVFAVLCLLYGTVTIG